MLRVASRTTHLARRVAQSRLPQMAGVGSSTTSLNRRLMHNSVWDLAGPPSGASTSSTPSTSSSLSPPLYTPSASFSETAEPIEDLLPVLDRPLPPLIGENSHLHDWSRSFHGLSSEPFSKEASDVLLAPLDPMDIEIKPDGMIYLPEIKYRRILNKAFGPGGWGLAPRGETNIGNKIVSREYGLVCLGRLVSVARGEQEYFETSGIATATEGCKSNALMRCCKDLGIASELWDPQFIKKFKKQHCTEAWGEHVVTRKKRKLWKRKDDKLGYPYEEK